MHITSLDPEPLHTLAYRTAAPGGGILNASFPILRGTIDRLPEGCKALIACSDLQGLADTTGADGIPTTRLLGEALADELGVLAELGMIPLAAQTSIVLCGDLYVRPALDARGGLGDVRSVWHAFARRFRWVAGVPGNHDAFGSAAERTAFAQTAGVYLLDGASALVDGVRVAGVGGIIGANGKPNRRDERTFLRELQGLLAERPEVLLLHQGPEVPAMRLTGDPRIRQVLERARDLLVLCGHVHWKTILAELNQGVQVANLEGRAIVLVSA